MARYIVKGKSCLPDAHPSLPYFISFIPFVPSATFFLPSLKRCKKLCYYFQVQINFGHGDTADVSTWKLRGNVAKPYNINTKSRINHLLMNNMFFSWCDSPLVGLGRLLIHDDFGQESEPSQATGMALVRCILGKFLGVVCHCFPLIFT